MFVITIDPLELDVYTPTADDCNLNLEIEIRPVWPLLSSSSNRTTTDPLDQFLTFSLLLYSQFPVITYFSVSVLYVPPCWCNIGMAGKKADYCNLRRSRPTICKPIPNRLRRRPTNGIVGQYEK